jgi:hypothetical protein
MPFVGASIGSICYVFSWMIRATALLFVARSRHSFAWVTTSFTNASIRLFPLSMDLLRAIKGGRSYSDEGEVALAFTISPIWRSGLILFAMALSLGLTALAAREYRFKKNRFIKSLLIYILSLGVGIGVVILDDLLGWNK